MIPNVKAFADFPVIQACHKPVINGTVCDLCGGAGGSGGGGGYVSYYDTTVISLEGFGGTTTTSSFTCTDLLYANNAHQISSDKCPDAIEVAQAECCAYACEICVYPLILDESKADDPLFDVLDFGETTCTSLQNSGSPFAMTNVLTVPPTLCPLLREKVADTCCVLLLPGADGESSEPSSSSPSKSSDSSSALSNNNNKNNSPTLSTLVLFLWFPLAFCGLLPPRSFY